MADGITTDNEAEPFDLNVQIQFCAGGQAEGNYRIAFLCKCGRSTTLPTDSEAVETEGDCLQVCLHCGMTKLMHSDTQTVDLALMPA